MITVHRTFIRTLTLSPQVQAASLSASTSASGKAKAPTKAGKATAKKIVKPDDLKIKNKTPILEIVEEKSTAIKTSSKELNSELKLLSNTATLRGRPLTSFTVIDLKEECAVRGLTKSGKKQDLVKKLERYILEHEILGNDKVVSSTELKSEPKVAKNAVKTDNLKSKSKTPILDIVEEKSTPIKTSSNELKSKQKVAEKAAKKAVKTDDLKSKSKTPILDIVEERLTAIKTSSNELKSEPKLAINITHDTASAATSQSIKTKTSAKNVEKKIEESIVSAKLKIDAPTKIKAETSTTSTQDAKKIIANEEKVEKEAEETAKKDTDLKAKKDSKENSDRFLHTKVQKCSLPGLNLGFFFGLFASFCLSLPFSFFLKNRKKLRPRLR